MSTRLPPRTLLGALVIALGAAPACAPGPATGADHTTPTPTPTPTPTSPTTSVANPAPPAPEVAATDDHWTITRDGQRCQAVYADACRPRSEPPDDSVMPSCKPPRPVPYACPEGAPSDEVTVVRYAGRHDCVIELPAMKCPKGATCHRLDPIVVPCPR